MKSTRKIFKPIQTLNARTFRSNKGRNLVAVLAVLMTALMFTTLFTLAQSMSKNIVEMTFRQTGYDAQASFRDITEEQAALLAVHPDVREVGTSIVLGIAENTELAGRQVEIRWADESYAVHSFAAPTTGRLPESAGEIALDTLTLDRLGLPHELGSQVTLEWRKDLNSSEVTSSVFTLCGFWEGNESSYAGMAWVSRDFADEMIAEEKSFAGADADTQTPDSASDGNVLGTFMAQVSLYSDQNIEADLNDILADTGLSDLEYSVNLAYSPEMGATAFQESLPLYLGMILVFIAGFLIIYNIFQISVTADIQFYGRLKTLGTTNRQIRRLIFGQAGRICLIGIPLGLLFGWLLGMVLVPSFLGILEGESTVSANPVIFIGSALFAWITVLLSCLRPARLAGKVSPIEALRMNDAASKSRKSRKRRRGSASLSSMAWSNLGRNKRRTVTVICSLTLALVLLCSFYAQNASFDIEKYLADLTLADFELTDSDSGDSLNGYDPASTSLSSSLVRDLENQEGLEASGHLYTGQADWQIDDDTLKNLQNFYTEDALADWETYDAAGAGELRAALKSREASARVYGLDGIPLDAITQEPYILQGSFDAEAFASGDYVLAVGPAIDLEQEYSVLPTPSAGSAIELNGRSYTVMAVVYPLTPVTEGAPEAAAADRLELEFILPLDAFRQQWPDSTLRKLFLNVDDEHIPEVQSFLDDYRETTDSSLPVTSRQTMAEQYEAETRSSSVMGNAVSIVIALVGILNFINSMVTAIVSRRREFAMIQSVGMTKKQLCRMLVYEGLFYAVITLAASFIVSALSVGILIRAMVSGGFSTFHFTLLPLGVCAPLLLLFAVLIPCLCFRNLEKQSIVVRLRME